MIIDAGYLGDTSNAAPPLTGNREEPIYDNSAHALFLGPVREVWVRLDVRRIERRIDIRRHNIRLWGREG